MSYYEHSNMQLSHSFCWLVQKTKVAHASHLKQLKHFYFANLMTISKPLQQVIKYVIGVINHIKCNKGEQTLLIMAVMRNTGTGMFKFV